MPIADGYKAVAVILTQSEHDELRDEAKRLTIERGQRVSVSSMLAERLRGGTFDPLSVTGEVRMIRSNGRELFISLTRFLRFAGMGKGDRVRVSWGRRRVIIDAEQTE